MTLEFLVALACLQPEACPELSKAYYASNPAIKTWTRKTTSQLEAQVGRQTVVAVPVAASVVVHKPFQIKMWRNVTCGMKADHSTLCIYSFGF